MVPTIMDKSLGTLFRASDRSRKKKSNFTGFLGTNSRKIGRFRGNFAGVLGANFTKTQSAKNGQFCDQTSIFNVFLTEVIVCPSTTIRSRNEPMAKSLTSWLVPSFSQLNLRLVVSGRCLHVSVMKF